MNVKKGKRWREEGYKKSFGRASPAHYSTRNNRRPLTFGPNVTAIISSIPGPRDPATRNPWSAQYRRRTGLGCMGLWSIEL